MDLDAARPSGAALPDAYDGGDGRQLRLTAQTLIELTAGVMQADAASLWWYDDDGAYLVARFPEDRMPTTEVFADMPEVGASIRADETRLYERAAATGLVREWMEAADIAVSLRLPVERAEVPRHFLSLSWAGEDHPAVDRLLPTARRFAEHIALTLARVLRDHVRVESALELSDNVAQALTIARASLDLGEVAQAERAIDRAFGHTQRMMTRLLRDDPASDYHRLYPSHTDVTPAGEDGGPAGP